MIDPETALLMADSRFALGREYSAPLGGATDGRLELLQGAVQLAISGDAPPDRLFDARFGSPMASVHVEGSTVQVVYQKHKMTRRAEHLGRIALNSTVRWRLEFHGGVAKMRADLQALQIEGLTIDGGVSHIEFALPRPAGPVPITITGGMHQVTIARPMDVAIRLTLRGGATSIAFDQQRLGVVGGEVVLATPGFDEAAGRYDVTATGGAAGIRIV